MMLAECLKTFPHKAALNFEILPNVGIRSCRQQIQCLPLGEVIQGKLLVFPQYIIVQCVW